MRSFPAHRAVLGQDGDAALALDGVVVHHGIDHFFVLGEGARLAQQLVDHGGLAVVNVGDDGDVADLFAHGVSSVAVFRICWISMGLSSRPGMSSPPAVWAVPSKVVALGSAFDAGP